MVWCGEGSVRTDGRKAIRWHSGDEVDGGRVFGRRRQKRDALFGYWHPPT
jgi:hypothetical protein